MAATVTGAPRPLVFADGTTYRFSPMSDKDIDELDMWVRAQFVRVARESLRGSDVSQIERDEIIRMAMREAMGLTFLWGPGAALMQTTAGLVRQAWQSIKKCHPEVTEDELRKQLLDPENINALKAITGEVNLPPDNVLRSPKPKRPRKAR